MGFLPKDRRVRVHERLKCRLWFETFQKGTEMKLQEDIEKIFTR